MSARRGACVLALIVIGLSACGDTARLQVSAGSGRQPVLPPPVNSLLPTVNIAPAIGWPAGQTPRAAPGLQVAAFARGLDHPRWLLVLPNGDVLVAETNAPQRPADSAGLRGWIMGRVMARAGAGVPSANRITLLRDADGDGVAEQRFVLLQGLDSPFGMALADGTLFIANTGAVKRYAYATGDTMISDPGSVLLSLPAGPINHHWTKNLIVAPDGRRLYVTVGSNSNVAEHGIEAEAGRAAVWEVDLATGAYRVFADGLRNPNGLAWAPGGTALWTVVNERDELGSDLVPDYMTALRDGAFYGWPYSWFGQHVDVRAQPQRPDLVARATVPDYALGPHTASLGLASSVGTSLPAVYAQGLFVGQHGSWNRRPHSGYRVVFVPFTGTGALNRPTGALPQEVLGGFLSDDGQAWGRPVGVALDRSGALLVADDVGNTVWRVTGRP